MPARSDGVQALEPSKKLENGLVGLLWGEGSSTQLSLRAEAKWIVCEVHIDHVIKLEEDGMIKFPEAEVVHTGTQDSSINYIATHIENYQASNISLIDNSLVSPNKTSSREFESRRT